MKRDMDLIRGLLLYIESKHDGDGPLRMKYEDFPSQDYKLVYGHIKLLEDAQFITGSIKFADAPPLIHSITWAGSDFVETIRDPEIWRKTKKVMAKAGGWTAELLAETAKSIATGIISAALTGASS